MSFGVMSWAGMVIASFGWGLLIAYSAIAMWVGLESSAFVAGGLGKLLLPVAQNAIFTGLALTVIGLLRKSHELMVRVERNGGRILAGPAVPPFPRPDRLHAVVSHPGERAAAPIAQPATQSGEQGPRRVGERAPDVIAQGRLSDRAYSLYSNGTVTVETRLGPRRFNSLSEAKDFVGDKSLLGEGAGEGDGTVAAQS